MRFGTINYFLGTVRLSSNFQTSYIIGKKGKKRLVISCETYLAPARPKSKKKKLLTRIIIHFSSALGNQVHNSYKKGDYALVQGQLRLVTEQLKLNKIETDLLPTNEYQLILRKISLIRSS
jgi:single-stranded DNA-binding protein